MKGKTLKQVVDAITGVYNTEAQAGEYAVTHFALIYAYIKADVVANLLQEADLPGKRQRARIAELKKKYSKN